MKYLIGIIVGSLLMSGCASSLKTFDSEKKESVGIPIASPVLVKITEKTTYEVDPNNTSFQKWFLAGMCAAA